MVRAERQESSFTTNSPRCERTLVRLSTDSLSSMNASGSRTSSALREVGGTSPWIVVSKSSTPGSADPGAEFLAFGMGSPWIEESTSTSCASSAEGSPLRKWVHFDNEAPQPIEALLLEHPMDQEVTSPANSCSNWNTRTCVNERWRTTDLRPYYARITVSTCSWIVKLSYL